MYLQAPTLTPQPSALPSSLGDVPPTEPATAGGEVAAPLERTVAEPTDFQAARQQPGAPDDPLTSRVLCTMLDIYRSKYGLNVATLVFKDVADSAARLRAWCDTLAPGQCGFALCTSGGGLHAFATAVQRDRKGRPVCLYVDSMSRCRREILLAVESAFEGHVYVTPEIQGDHEPGCLVFTLRFLLMTRSPDLGQRILDTLEAFDRSAPQVGPACARQLLPDDLVRLASWLAPTRHRSGIDPHNCLLGATLGNGGKHSGWTLAEFFRQRPDTLVLELRRMYAQVDTLVHGGASRGSLPLEESRRAYLEKRFLRYLPSDYGRKA